MKPSVTALPLPDDSLLARYRGPECYRDASACTVTRPVAIEEFIFAFYASLAFLPERLALYCIGCGGNRRDIAALAQGAGHFAAWTVEAREEQQILLRDFQDFSCSWLAVEPLKGDGTRLWFGTGLRRSEQLLTRAMNPAHRWYARWLLGGAAGALRLKDGVV